MRNIGKGEAELPSSGPLPTSDRLRPIALRLFELAAEGSYADYRLQDALDQVSRAGGLETEIAGHLRARAKQLLNSAAAALGETQSEYHDSVYKPRLRGGELLEFAKRLERPEIAQSHRPALLKALDRLNELGAWEESEPCGEPLFQATPEPRRFPLARYILRHCRRRFGMLIADEWHEYSNKGSA